MARVPITVMGYRCERCSHEWIPRDSEQEPSVCPKCNSTYWNSPRKKPAASMLTYEEFKAKIQKTLRKSGPLTWTEIRTIAKLPEKFPNNKWVRHLEEEIGLKRERDTAGIFKWKV